MSDCDEPVPAGDVDVDGPTSELDEPVAEVEKYFCGADGVVDSAATYVDDGVRRHGDMISAKDDTYQSWYTPVQAESRCSTTTVDTAVVCETCHGDGCAPGTGPGLSTSRGFVEAMGGTITAEILALRKRGTRIVIRLPVGA